MLKTMESVDMKWMGRNWIKQETWGQVHPEKSNVWYDPSAVILDSENRLHLLTQYHPKYFKEVNDVVPVGVGLVCCLDSFHFGRYTIEAKLPVGKNLWSAIWLYSLGGEYAEIDIVEAYSNVYGSYCSFRPFRLPAIYKLDSNFHYIKDEEWVTIGTKTHYVGFENPTKRFITYDMVWTPESIKLYADGRLQRVLKGKVMEHFQRPMRMVLNNSIRFGREYPIEQTDFVIKHFNYKPL